LRVRSPHRRARRRPLEEALDALPPCDPRDRAAGHRLAAAVLRRMGSLDAVLEPYLKKASPTPVRHVLRIGAAGLLLLETPPHAAVATAVALARSRGLVPFCPLVNAVLRKVATAGPSAFEELDSPRLDTPAWLWAAWGRDARAIAEAHQSENGTYLTLRPGTSAPPGGVLPPVGSWYYPPGTRITTLPGFETGDFWVQDAAAALPARLLAAQPGERIADLCAAPGGKTAQLAMAGAVVTAVERDPARIVRLRENLARLRLDVEIICTDAAKWTPPTPLDAILLDAPCSATGTIRRHPDVAHIKRPSDMPSITAAQDRLIEAAASMLKPGARMVYAVCSLQPEEGPARIQAALQSGLWKAAPFLPGELPGIEDAMTPEGFVRTTPSLWLEQGGVDGFFIARMLRS
jgi:16S rRNA (cytosine967-C5)-methyltransferase